jgi:hypothetical protein
MLPIRETSLNQKMNSLIQQAKEQHQQQKPSSQDIKSGGSANPYLITVTKDFFPKSK